MTLRELIIDYRTKHNLSQRQFANLCGLSNGYISMIEADENPHSGKPIVPSLDSFVKLAKGLGVPAIELFNMLSQSSNTKNALSPDEQKFLTMYRKLNEEQKNLIMLTMKSLSK